MQQDDHRFFYHYNSRTKGACGARNTGIEASSGDYIVFLDDDDEIAPRAIEKFVDHGSVGSFLYSWQKRIYQDQSKKNRVSKKIPMVDFQTLVDAGQNLCTIMIFVPAEHLKGVGMFDEYLPASQDYDLVLNLTRLYGEAYCVPEALFSIYSGEAVERISNNMGKKYRGRRRIHLKNKPFFSRQQRKQYAYKTRMTFYGENCIRALYWLPFGEALGEIRRWLKKKFIK